MVLPDDFHFSQSSLQDYADCPRRFELRYLAGLTWPAPIAEPIAEHEARLTDGEAFHRLVHQHAVGLPPDRLTAMAIAQAHAELEPGLPDWWQNYLASAPADLPPKRWSEISLSAALAGYRLVAKFDLIAIAPASRAIIVDWKTGGRPPAAAWLAARLQTRVYRWLLVSAGAHLNDGEPIRPEQVEMIYWFAARPDEPVRLRYDARQYTADTAYLHDLIAEIRDRANREEFPLTPDVKRCRYCPYRSLCDRGAEAGELDEEDGEASAIAEEMPTDWQTSFDFEQIAEIAF